MKKLRTKAEIWTYMADLWDKPVRAEARPGMPRYEYYAKIGESLTFGLCVTLQELCRLGVITHTNCDRCLDDIQYLPNYGSSCFKWPLTRDGARQRAEFCRRQSAKCRKR